jgi:3-oxoacyl-[acyl-carrier protein] reductase
MSSEKRVAVIMGGGGDIGSVICRTFAGKGIQVVISDYDASKAEYCAESLRQIGAEPFIAKGDITSKAETQKICDAVIDKYKRVDILVNSQGSIHNELLFKLTENAWKQTMSVHVDGTLNSMMAFGPVMRAQNYGRIINMSSIAVLGSLAGASYGAAKGAIEGLSRTAALEWARYGITVNCVAPGLIGTGMFLTTPQHFQDSGIERTPMRRAGKPEEVAETILFLASEGAGFITGQTIFICGGLSIGF